MDVSILNSEEPHTHLLLFDHQPYSQYWVPWRESLSVPSLHQLRGLGEGWRCGQGTIRAKAKPRLASGEGLFCLTGIPALLQHMALRYLSGRWGSGFLGGNEGVGVSG